MVQLQASVAQRGIYLLRDSWPGARTAAEWTGADSGSTPAAALRPASGHCAIPSLILQWPLFVTQQWHVEATSQVLASGRGFFPVHIFPFASSSAASSSPVRARVQFGIVSNPVASNPVACAAVLKFTWL